MEGSGWYNESKRHALAREGIKTGRAITNIQNTLPVSSDNNDLVYPSNELYPEEYAVLNQINPLFEQVKEENKSLLSVPKFETEKSKKEVAPNFERKLMDY